MNSELEYWRNLAETALDALTGVYEYTLLGIGFDDNPAIDEADRLTAERAEISEKELDFILHGELNNAWLTHCGKDVDYGEE